MNGIRRRREAIVAGVLVVLVGLGLYGVFREPMEADVDEEPVGRVDGGVAENTVFGRAFLDSRELPLSRKVLRFETTDGERSRSGRTTTGLNGEYRLAGLELAEATSVTFLVDDGLPLRVTVEPGSRPLDLLFKSYSGEKGVVLLTEGGLPVANVAATITKVGQVGMRSTDAKGLLNLNGIAAGPRDVIVHVPSVNSIRGLERLVHTRVVVPSSNGMETVYLAIPDSVLFDVMQEDRTEAVVSGASIRVNDRWEGLGRLQGRSRILVAGFPTDAEIELVAWQDRGPSRQYGSGLFRLHGGRSPPRLQLVLHAVSFVHLFLSDARGEPAVGVESVEIGTHPVPDRQAPSSLFSDASRSVGWYTFYRYEGRTGGFVLLAPGGAGELESARVDGLRDEERLRLSEHLDGYVYGRVVSRRATEAFEKLLAAAEDQVARLSEDDPRRASAVRQLESQRAYSPGPEVDRIEVRMGTAPYPCQRTRQGQFLWKVPGERDEADLDVVALRGNSVVGEARGVEPGEYLTIEVE